MVNYSLTLRGITNPATPRSPLYFPLLPQSTMASIRNNGSAITFNYMLGKQQKTLMVMPGINLNIPDEDVEALHKHPIFTAMYENETVEILTRDPVKTSELEGFQVVDSKRNGEPLPVFDTPKLDVIPDPTPPEERLPILSKPQLLEMPGIGDGYAQKILSRQPESGYESFSQLKGLNEDLSKLKEDNWKEIEERVKS